MSQGWISLYRQIQEHWLFPLNEKREFTKFEAWIDLLLMVNHETKKIMFNNTLIEVEKGQKITSIKYLSERWKWSRKKASSFLKLLEKEHQIIQKRTSKMTLVNIVNYESYQHDDVEKRGKGTSETEKKNIKRTSEEHQKNTNNNGNNGNNDNKKESTLRSKLKFETHHMKLAELFFKKIQENNPNAKQPNLESWASVFRLMMERDKRDGKEVQEMILYCQQHHFWFKNILSPDKLRKQFDRLQMEMKDDEGLKVIKGGAKNAESSFENDYSKYDFSKRRNLRGLPEEN